jgi:hypothetical protein
MPSAIAKSESSDVIGDDAKGDVVASCELRVESSESVAGSVLPYFFPLSFSISIEDGTKDIGFVIRE